MTPTPEREQAEHLVADLLAILREHRTDTDYENFLARLESDLRSNLIHTLTRTAAQSAKRTWEEAAKLCKNDNCQHGVCCSGDFMREFRRRAILREAPHAQG